MSHHIDFTLVLKYKLMRCIISTDVYQRAGGARVIVSATDEGEGPFNSLYSNPWKADAAHLDRGSSTGALSPTSPNDGWCTHYLIIKKRNNI